VHPLSHILDTLAKGAGVRPAGALDYQARERERVREKRLIGERVISLAASAHDS
jgi:hypothetical protein